MKKWISILVGVIILVFATNAGCFWAEDEMLTDPRPRKVVESHNIELATKYPEFTITDIWIDASGYVIFIDWNNDGIEDTAHIHQVVFFMEDGTPVFVCQGNHAPDEVREGIEEWIRHHSAKGRPNEETVSRTISVLDDRHRVRWNASKR